MNKQKAVRNKTTDSKAERVDTADLFWGNKWGGSVINNLQ